MENIQFDRNDLIDIRSFVIPMPEGTVRIITPCIQAVITACATQLLSIILAEMNSKGKFGWWGYLRVGNKVVLAAWDIVTIYKTCNK